MLKHKVLFLYRKGNSNISPSKRKNDIMNILNISYVKEVSRDLMKLKSCLWILCVLVISACSSNQEYPSAYEESPSMTKADLLLPEASQSENFSDGIYIEVDMSHTSNGYIMARMLHDSEQRLKLMIQKGEQKYNYDITSKEYQSFPLQMGSGSYEIRLLRQSEGNTYVRLATTTFDVVLDDSLSPFLYPNQIVNYTGDSESVALSFSLVENDKTDLERIRHIYQYVIENISYDHEKADAVKDSFVLPDPDETLSSKKGICFDYASLLATMLRVQHIPTRLITGYTDIEYHAWVEIYLAGEGWINPKVYFEKETWSRMDPTFAASNQDYEGRYDEVYVY